MKFSFILLSLFSFASKAFAASGDVLGDAGGGLENPLEIGTLMGFVEKILNIVVTIGIPIIAIFIIYSGFLFVKAQGNEAELKKAKDTFLYTIVGAAIVLGSWIFAQAIAGTINALK